jgi:tRNA1(Val) A37 N6-methylase TrmN6
VWAELLDELQLQGDERILDLGCGRGAVLLLAAQHLTTGQAIGVDLWRRSDQSGNSAEATRRNALAEGVAERVELHTADMTLLQAEDNASPSVTCREEATGQQTTLLYLPRSIDRMVSATIKRRVRP